MSLDQNYFQNVHPKSLERARQAGTCLKRGTKLVYNELQGRHQNIYFSRHCGEFSPSCEPGQPGLQRLSLHGLACQQPYKAQDLPQATTDMLSKREYHRHALQAMSPVAKTLMKKNKKT